MKNEERILELLVETLQRIDRHHEEIERLNKKFDRHSEQFDQQSDQLKRHSELMLMIVNKLQVHDEHLDKHTEALSALRERTEVMHQSSLEQQQAYRAMTELLMHHNRILTAKGIF